MLTVQSYTTNMDHALSCGTKLGNPYAGLEVTIGSEFLKVSIVSTSLRFHFIGEEFGERETFSFCVFPAVSENHPDLSDLRFAGIVDRDGVDYAVFLF